MITISTHNGSTVARQHNVRQRRVVEKENHINLDGVHEVWFDEDHRKAYDRIFGEAVATYNEKQKREDRKISSYYDEVCKDERRHPIYEMIVGVYGDEVDDESGKEIMKKFVDTWKDRNPNLELIGAYYHADEDGAPHVHIDYVPVAHGYRRGMEMQAGLDKALREQGFESTTIHKTAQIAWEKRENAFLEELCKERGYEVDHPEANKGSQHLKTEIFKLRQEYLKINSMNEALLEENEKLVKEKDYYKKEANLIYQKYKQIETQITEKIDSLNTKHNEAKLNLDMVIMAMKDAELNVQKLLESALDKGKQKEYEANINRDLERAESYIKETEELIEEDYER